jgi:hypothetical protein
MIIMSIATGNAFAGRAAGIGLWSLPLYGLLLGLSTITHQPSVIEFMPTPATRAPVRGARGWRPKPGPQ